MTKYYDKSCSGSANDYDMYLPIDFGMRPSGIRHIDSAPIVIDEDCANDFWANHNEGKGEFFVWEMLKGIIITSNKIRKIESVNDLKSRVSNYVEIKTGDTDTLYISDDILFKFSSWKVFHMDALLGQAVNFGIIRNYLKEGGKYYCNVVGVKAFDLLDPKERYYQVVGIPDLIRSIEEYRSLESLHIGLHGIPMSEYFVISDKNIDKYSCKPLPSLYECKDDSCTALERCTKKHKKLELED